MDDELAEIIDAHVQGIAIQKPAHDARQYRRIVEYCRGVHDYARNDRPEIAYVAEEYVQCAQKHADAEVYEIKTYHRIQQV